MTENKRYKVAIYDEKAISGYCVLDLEKPSQTARLKYNNVFIGTKEGCDIVCELLNEQDERIKELETRNKRQYERLKELTDLMFKRDWETLNDMVDEWEREDEYLRKYGG